MAAHNVFSIIKAIRTKKGLPEWAEISKEYSAYLTNKAFSFDMQTILLAAEVNKTHMPAEWAYAFYSQAATKNNRYSEWIKAPKPHDAALLTQICETYNCSIAKAIDIAALLTEEQVDILMGSKGGRG